MIASEAAASLLIQAYFSAGWGSACAVIYDDDPASIPDNAPFCRLTIKHGEGDQSSMGSPGSNRHEQRGRVYAQICVPQGDAGLTAKSLASQAAALFRGKSTNEIEFYQTAVREQGNDGRGYFVVTATARFRYPLYA